MEIDYDYLRTGTAIGFRASHELCSNYLFSLSLGSRFFLILLICLVFFCIVLIRVDVSVPSGAFLSLAGILLFIFVLLLLSMSVLNEINN